MSKAQRVTLMVVVVVLAVLVVVLAIVLGQRLLGSPGALTDGAQPLALTGSVAVGESAASAS